MTRRPSRLRRWLKWVGLVGCGVVVVAWVASLRWAVGYHRDHYLYLISNGRVSGFDTLPLSWIHPSQRWLFERSSPSDPAGGTSTWALLVPQRVAVSMWIMFLGAATPTGILWYRDRHPPPGHCHQCGYNLTGNLSGVCPECGTDTPKPTLHK